MCWSAEVSIKTFLFGIIVLSAIIYNNTYTQYKIRELDNIGVYLFLASFIFMQLIEFFLWRNLQRGFYNHLFSLMAVGLLFIQPLCSLAILSDTPVRQTMMVIYGIFAVPYVIYKLLIQDIYTVKSKLGHLKWKLLNLETVPFLFWLFFLVFSLMYQKRWYSVLFALSLLVICTFNYMNDQTVGSMWCWILNSIMIYYAFVLLVYLPLNAAKFPSVSWENVLQGF